MRLKPINWKGVLVATVSVLAAAAVAPLLQRLPHANLSLLFMTVVLLMAVRYGLGISLYTSLLSFLIFNYFFTSPYYTFAVTEEGDVATLVFFLIIAALVGNLAARMRDETLNRIAALDRVSLLQQVSRQLAGAAAQADVLDIMVARLAEVAGAPAFGVMANHSDQYDQNDTVRAVTDDCVIPPLEQLEKAIKVKGKVGDWSLIALQTYGNRPGIIGVRRGIDDDIEPMIAGVVEQGVVAMERALLVGDLEQERLVSEREQLRAALLSSVSHDLRTPLASIIGSASSLIDLDHALAQQSRAELLDGILKEAERLDRHIQNLLDMARLGQGRIELHPDWVDTRDLISSACRRLHLPLDGKRTRSEVDEAAQLLYVHGDLVEQAIVNVLDNAIRYSPEDGLISIHAYVVSGNEVYIDIADSGPGIPAADREKVFAPYYRAANRDRSTGTGLGLSICRGMIRAHGGDVSAHPGSPEQGCLIRMHLPLIEYPGTQRQSFI